MRVFERSGMAAFWAAFFMAASLSLGLPASATPPNNTIPGVATSNGDVLLCSGTPWVDVRCNGADPTDTGDSTSAFATTISQALAGGFPVHISAGKYKISSTLTIDTSGFAASGFKIVSDNATLDGATVASGPVLVVQRSGGTTGSPAVDQNFTLAGDLTVLGSDAAYVCQIGRTDFSDEFKGARIEGLVCSNASSATGAGGLKVNYAIGARLALFGTTAGGSASIAGVAIEQAQDSQISGAGAASGASAASLLIENGASTGNTVSGFSYGAVSPVCLSITSASAQLNAFVAPNFGCTTAVNATGSGTQNMLIPPVFGGANRGPISGGISIVGRGALARYSAPAVSSYTALCSDDGTMFSAANATGASSSWSAASLPVTLPNPATCGPGYSIGFLTDAGKAVVLTPASGSILAGGTTLSSMTLGPNNFEFLVLRSDGANWRVDQSSAASLVYNGAAPPGVPARWEFPGGGGYAATQGDNASVISSGLTSGGLAVTLPSTTAIRPGWTVGLAADTQPLTVQANGVSGGTIYLPSGAAVTTAPYTLFSATRYQAWVQFDGANFRLMSVSGANMTTTTAQLRSLTGGSVMWSMGYHTFGDMPGLEYVWQASCPGTPDNVGFLLAPTAGGPGCWEAQFAGGEIDDRWFGVYGDASHNDTVAWQALLTYAQSVGAPIKIAPNSLALITSTLTATQPVTIHGQNPTNGNDSQTCSSGFTDVVSSAPGNINLLSLTGTGSKIDRTCFLMGTNTSPATSGTALTIGAPPGGAVANQAAEFNTIKFAYVGIAGGGSTGNGQGGGGTNSLHLIHNWVVSPNLAGITLGAGSNNASTTALIVKENRVTCAVSAPAAYGIAIYDAAMDHFAGNEENNCVHGTAIIPGTVAGFGQVELGFYEDVLGDSSQVNNLLINATTPLAHIIYTTFNNWWAAMNTGESGSSVLIENTGGGVVQNISLVGGTAHGANDTAGPQNIIELEGNVSGIVISANIIAADGAGGGTMSTGIYDNSSGFGLTIAGNNFVQNQGTLAVAVHVGPSSGGERTIVANNFHTATLPFQFDPTAVNYTLVEHDNSPLATNSVNLTPSGSFAAPLTDQFAINGSGPVNNMTGWWQVREIRIRVNSAGFAFQTGGGTGGFCRPLTTTISPQIVMAWWNPNLSCWDLQ